MVRLIYNPNTQNKALWNNEVVPLHIATRRHEIYCKVMFGQPLTKPEQDIFKLHIAPCILNNLHKGN